MRMTLERMLARDAECTAFKHVILENPYKPIPVIVDEFDFQMIDAVKYRELLILIGSDARYHPHRVPPKQ